MVKKTKRFVKIKHQKKEVYMVTSTKVNLEWNIEIKGQKVFKLKLSMEFFPRLFGVEQFV